MGYSMVGIVWSLWISGANSVRPGHSTERRLSCLKSTLTTGLETQARGCRTGSSPGHSVLNRGISMDWSGWKG